MNLHIPMAVCLTASILAGCTQKLQQLDTQPHPTALNGNVQPARLDVYAASPEVVRYAAICWLILPRALHSVRR